MINTIFYFPETYNTYLQNKNNISDRTICFVRETGQIFKDGVEYGKGSTGTGTSYILPAASSSELGGIKVGYSANGKNYPVLLDSDNKAYVNVTAEGGTTTVENPYNDDWIHSQLDEIDSKVDESIKALSGKLDDIVQYDSEKVKEDVQKMLDEFNWLKENYPDWGIIFNESGWDDAMKAYLQRVGLISTDGDSATWSELVQKYNSIEASVKSIQESIGDNGELDLNTLLSNLELYVDEATRTAIADLKTEWSNSSAFSDGEIEVLRWAIAGFDAETNEYSNLAKMYADRFDGVNKGIAAVQTEITTVDGKIDTVEASLTTKLNDKTAGLITQSELDTALASLFATDGEGTAKITAAIKDGISSIKADADFIELVAQQVNTTTDELTVTNSDGVVIAEIKKDGTCKFMNGNIKANYTVDSNDPSSVTGVGIRVDNPLDDSALYTSIQAASVGWQERGIRRSDIFSSTSADNGGYTITMEAYSNNTFTSQNENDPNKAALSLRGGSNRLLWTNAPIETDGTVQASGYKVGSNSGITQTLQVLNGTATFKGGILTGFTAHTDNIHTEMS